MPKRRVIFLNTVVVSLLCNAFFGGMRRTLVDRDRAHHPNVCFGGGRGPGVRRCGHGDWWQGGSGSYSCPRHSRSRPFVSNEVRVFVAETTFGLPWHLSGTLLSGEVGHGGSLSWVDLGPMLATDDVVRLRVAASRWNKGDWYGPFGRVFFKMLTLARHKKLCHYDTGGNRVIT